MSTPSSTVQPRGLSGPATFRGSPSSAPKPPSRPPPPCGVRSPALLGLRPQPFPQACFLAHPPPQVLFPPAHLMLFPLVTLCRLRRARFTYVCYCFVSCFQLVEGAFPLVHVVEFRACMWARDRYGPQLKRYVPDFSFVSSFWILGFVFAIASAPCDFLYLNNEYMI